MRKSFLLLLIILITFFSSCSVNFAGKSKITPFTGYQDSTVVQAEYTDAWDAMQNFDTVKARKFAMTPEQSRFADGLDLIFQGEYKQAKELYKNLVRSTTDSVTLKHANFFLRELSYHFSNWEQAIQTEESTSVADTLNSIGLAKAFLSAPQETIVFPAEPVKLPLKISKTGVPLVMVTVNGVQKYFWIDTGASQTVLASDFAQECHVTPLNEEKILTGTSTDKNVGIDPAIIETFEIGELVIKNHPVIIIDKKDLEFKLLGFIPLIKIDGIVGWLAIKQLKMTMDYKNKLLTIEKPYKENKERNFFWMEIPFVKITSAAGRQLYFDLDTGADHTSLSEHILTKVDTTNTKKTKTRLGGAGGFQDVETTQFGNFSLVSGNHVMSFEKITTSPNLVHDFFKYDGRLGSDTAQDGTMILDFTNGRFDLIFPDNL